MELLSREEAIKKELKRYFTGIPCKKNHISERNTTDGKCLRCKCEWMVKKYKEDEDFRKRQRAYRKKYQVLNSKKLSEISRKWAIENPEKDKEVKRQAYLKNKAEYIKRASEWSQNNKEKCREVRKKWKMNNPFFVALDHAKRRSLEIMAIPKWADKNKIKQIYKEAHKKGMDVDHIIPLRSKYVCGLHVENNLQLLTPQENWKKGNRLPKEDLLCVSSTF